MRGISVILILLVCGSSAISKENDIAGLLKKGEDAFHQNELDSAHDIFFSTFWKAYEDQDTLGVLTAFKGILNVKWRDRDFRSIPNIMKVFGEHSSIRYSEMLTKAHVVLGMYYLAREDYDLVVSHLDSIYNAADTHLMNGFVGAVLLSCKGDAHSELGQFDEARIDFEKSIRIFKRLKVWGQVRRVQMHYAVLYSNSGMHHEALKRFRKILSEVEKFRGTKDEMHLYNHIANCFNDSQVYDSAKVYFDKSAMVARTLNLQGMENLTLKNLSTASENAEILANQKAENTSLQRNIMILVAGVVLLLAVVVFIVLRGRLKRQRLLQEQETLLHQQHINDLLQEQEIASMNAEMDGMRDERDRVAKDLHDRLGGMMGALRIQFDHVSESIGEKQPEINQKMDKATEMLNESVGEIRKVAHNMASAAISEFGFEKAVAKLVERITSSSKLNISFSESGDDFQFKSGVEMELYKIIQELISNILKHAKANDVHIESSIHDGVLQLIVEDDGIGFNASKSSNGLGINSLKQRVDKLKGKLIYDSSPGKGTTVIVEVPI